MGVLSVTRPTARGSGIALIVETSNAEAHACMYMRHNWLKPIIANNQYVRILHTHERHCCFDVLTISLELPDSEPSSTKRKITLFPIYRFSNSTSPILVSALLSENICKDKKKFWTSKEIHRKIKNSEFISFLQKNDLIGKSDVKEAVDINLTILQSYNKKTGCSIILYYCITY